MENVTTSMTFKATSSCDEAVPTLWDKTSDFFGVAADKTTNFFGTAVDKTSDFVDKTSDFVGTKSQGFLDWMMGEESVLFQITPETPVEKLIEDTNEKVAGIAASVKDVAVEAATGAKGVAVEAASETANWAADAASFVGSLF